MYSVNLEEWNLSAGFENYPVEIKDEDSGSITTASAASIALAPTYLGGDDVERVAFVGMAATTDNEKGVYRLEDYINKNIKSTVDINSVAYDGANLVAGNVDNTRVWRCDEPLETSPTFYQSSTTKSP